jgi:hypothetical protein
MLQDDPGGVRTAAPQTIALFVMQAGACLIQWVAQPVKALPGLDVLGAAAGATAAQTQRSDLSQRVGLGPAQNVAPVPVASLGRHRQAAHDARRGE